MMNLGDGLTLQTRTVNGKQTTGIFLLDSNASKSKKNKFNYKSKTLRYPIREKVPPIPKNAWENKVNKNQRSKLPSNEENNDKKETDEKVKTLNSPRNKKDQKSENLQSKEQEVKDRLPVSKENKNSLNSKKRIPDIRPNKTKKEPTQNNKREDDNKKESGTNPKYVTLTQDQLNTILSLVKTKHEIDVGKVIEKNDDDKSDSESQNSSFKTETDNAAESDDDIVTIRPTSVPGLDLSEDENATKNKDIKKEKKSSKRNKNVKEKKSTGMDKEKDKEDDKTDKEEERDSKEDTEKEGESFPQSTWGVLGGFGSRDKEKSRIEGQRQQWIKELNEQVNRNKKLKDDEFRQRKGITSISSPEIDNQQNVQEEKKEDESIMNLLGEEGDKNKTSNKKSKEKSRKEALKKEEKSKKKTKSAPSSAKKSETELTSIEPPVIRDLPAAIRSSFFPGESAPREHAYSASKQAQQRRWREELDKQREEQKTKREKEKNLRMSVEDDNLWARHFDTMEPKKVVDQPAVETSHDYQQSQTPEHTASVAAPIPSARLPQNTNPQPENIVSQSSSSISVIAGGYAGKQESTGVRDPNKNNYLRTMTSLLDPAQIEAMEVRRKKQEEHRNAIAAQVEEQRKRKEAEDDQQRHRDAIEEERLRMERQQLDHQFEIEKLRQKMQESKREEQTNKLHQQLQEAEANALRDKLKQREKVLRARGHDTSLLEQAHNTALRSHRPAESSKKSTVTLQPPADNQPTTHQAEAQNDLRLSSDLSPISLVANTDQGPIRLQISLNGIHNPSRETAIQTTNTETQVSDTETEYLSLPQRRTKDNNKKTKQSTKGNNKRATSLQKYEDNLNAQYDKYSRREANATNQPKQQKVKGDEPKPKWGAASKGKKFVPASQRYVKSMKWNEKHEQNVRRREEELLHQQALNDHEHLQAASRARLDGEPDILTGRRRAASPPIPTLAHRMEEEREKKSHRSRSPNRSITTKTNVVKNRSLSPVPKTKKISPRQKQNTTQHTEVQRPDTVISVTTDKAKYRAGKHTRESPVPQTTDFVEYRRTTDVLNYGDETPPTPEPIKQQVERHQQHDPMEQPIPNKDPLTNPDMVKQRERQDQILREISILRQGLLLKQREVASYPVAMPTQTPMMYSGNLPERTNDTPRE